MTLDKIKQKILARCVWKDGPLATPCLVWTGYRDRYGYGHRVKHNNEELVHRLMYSIEKGEIPKGLFICHHCDNPPCCNVDHLFRGSSGDNLEDAYSKGLHSGAVLTKADVQFIKYFLQNGWGFVELGRRYGVSPGTIRDIKKERSWRRIRPFQPIEGEPLPVPPPVLT
jgi:HNH endonuclease